MRGTDKTCESGVWQSESRRRNIEIPWGTDPESKYHYQLIGDAHDAARRGIE